jgi:hypothetical protein
MYYDRSCIPAHPGFLQFSHHETISKLSEYGKYGGCWWSNLGSFLMLYENPFRNVRGGPGLNKPRLPAVVCVTPPKRLTLPLGGIFQKFSAVNSPV